MIGDDVCVSDKKVITENLVSGFCTDNACDTYKKCAASGICTDVTCSSKLKPSLFEIYIKNNLFFLYILHY